MILYKYLTPARVDVLERRRIRFTQPAAFNDPFEFKPYIESAAPQEHLREYVEQNFDEILRRELKEYPILSRLLPGESAVDLLRTFKSSIPGLFQLLEPHLLPGVSAAIVGVLCLSEIRDSLPMWGHYTGNHEGFVIGFDERAIHFSRFDEDPKTTLAFCGGSSTAATGRESPWLTQRARNGLRQNPTSGPTRRSGACCGYWRVPNLG